MEMVPNEVPQGAAGKEQKKIPMSPFEILLKNEKVKNRVLVSLEVLFCQAKVSGEDSEDLVFKIKDIIEEAGSEEDFIFRTRALLDKYKVTEGIENVRGTAMNAKVDTVKAYLGEKVLDMGAGSGRLSEVIEEKTDSIVTSADIDDFNETERPYVIYDGEKLPLDTDSQDTVLLMMVLHHSEDFEQVLNEAKRVSSGNVVIGEPVYLDNEMDKQRSLVVDWFIARVLQKSEMAVPGNMKSVLEWEEKFMELGFEVEVSEDFCESKINKKDCFEAPVVVERSWLFVLREKQE